MLRRLALLVVLGAALTVRAAAEPVTTIRSNGNSSNRLDLVVLGDGYTAAEIANGKYATDVENFLNGMFAQEPYSEYRRYFNVHRIDVASAESGADHPSRGLLRNTALGAAYDCGGITRLICVDTNTVSLVVGRSVAPTQRDLTLVIVNDPEYGGSGGSVAVASIESSVVELVLHEMGHSLGLLADEYGGPPPPACNSSVEPSAANATLATVRGLIKWNAWIDASTAIPTVSTTNGVPGLFQGASYCDTGVYRPTFNSKMRSLFFPFYQINTEQLIKRFYNYVSPLDDASPAGTSVTVNRGQHFSVTIPQPFTHALTSSWRLDGVTVATGSEYIIDTPGAHTLSVTVSDPTALVRNDPSNVLRTTRTWSVTVPAPSAPSPTDFDGDNKSEIGVYRPSSGEWFVRQSHSGFASGDFLHYQWGLVGDVQMPGDFDGDRKVDLVVYRPTTGEWFIRYSSTGYALGGFGFYQWGLPGDTPLAADFDGDRKADLVVYRPSSGQWFIRYSSNGYATGGYGLYQWGLQGDVPMTGDFDGDGRTDLAVYRPSTGEWYVLDSATGYDRARYRLFQWGLPGDLPLIADFDGDGKTELVVYRPSTGEWFVRYSSTAYVTSGFGLYQWGLPGDAPVVADLDGDGKTDLTVYRPSTGDWFVRLSSDSYLLGLFRTYQWGLPGDTPIR